MPVRLVRVTIGSVGPVARPERQVFMATRISTIATFSFLSLLTGCSKQEPRTEYQAFSGTVRAADIETGELFVRSDHPPQPGKPGRDLPCVVTKDAEIYINDRFASIQEITVGDSVELIGYRDADRFVVSFATITRAEPPPTLPAIFQSATSPASQPPKE